MAYDLVKIICKIWYLITFVNQTKHIIYDIFNIISIVYKHKRIKWVFMSYNFDVINPRMSFYTQWTVIG